MGGKPAPGTSAGRRMEVFAHDRGNVCYVDARSVDAACTALAATIGSTAVRVGEKLSPADASAVRRASTWVRQVGNSDA